MGNPDPFTTTHTHRRTRTRTHTDAHGRTRTQGTLGRTKTDTHTDTTGAAADAAQGHAPAHTNAGRRHRRVRTGNQRRAGTAFGAEGAALFLSLSAPQAQVRAPRATPRGGLVGVGAHVHLVAVKVAKVDVGAVPTVRAAGHASDAAWTLNWVRSSA